MKVEVLLDYANIDLRYELLTYEHASEFRNACSGIVVTLSHQETVLRRNATKGQAFWFFLESLCQIGGLSRRSAQLSPLHGVGYLGPHYHNHRQSKSFFHASIKTHHLDWVIYITLHSSCQQLWHLSFFVPYLYLLTSGVSRSPT